MAENQNTTADPKDAWLDGLTEQLPHAHIETLKAILDHSSKMLDHVYAANDGISQKARWAIRVLVVVIGIMVRLAIGDAKSTGGTHPSCLFWTMYGLLVLILGWSLWHFYKITKAETHYHSGVAPRDAYLKETLRDTQKFVDDKNRSSGLDFGYFVASAMEEYQRRIDKGRELNIQIAGWFNTGLHFMLLALGIWIVNNVLFNALGL